MEETETSAAGNPILVNLFRQSQWANLELIDACAGLDPSFLDAESPGTLGTVRTTLWHIIENERRLLAALTGELASGLEPLAGSPDGELATLRVHAHDTGQGLQAWAEAVEGDPLLTGEWNSRPYSIAASVFVSQALLHATEHRTQIQIVASRSGYDLPNLDTWSWWNVSLEAGQEPATI